MVSIKLIKMKEINIELEKNIKKIIISKKIKNKEKALKILKKLNNIVKIELEYFLKREVSLKNNKKILYQIRWIMNLIPDVYYNIDLYAVMFRHCLSLQNGNIELLDIFTELGYRDDSNLWPFKREMALKLAWGVSKDDMYDSLLYEAENIRKQAENILNFLKLNIKLARTSIGTIEIRPISEIFIHEKLENLNKSFNDIMINEKDYVNQIIENLNKIIHFLKEIKIIKRGNYSKDLKNIKTILKQLQTFKESIDTLNEKIILYNNVQSKYLDYKKLKNISNIIDETIILLKLDFKPSRNEIEAYMISLCSLREMRGLSHNNLLLSKFLDSVEDLIISIIEKSLEIVSQEFH